MPRVATFFVAWRALTSAEEHRHNQKIVKG